MCLPIQEGLQIQLWKIQVMMKGRGKVLQTSVAATGRTEQKLEQTLDD
jgi:hypothetical protein